MTEAAAAAPSILRRPPVVAVVDPFHPRVLATLRAAAPDDWRFVIAEGPAPEQHAAALAEADLLFLMATPAPAALIDRAPRLVFIQKLGAGVDRIAVERCAELGVGVARLQAGNAIPVAEHTLLLMLAACRRLPLLDRRTRAGGWDKEAARGESRQLHGMCVGLVGFGAIGRAVAALLRPFGARVVYYDPRRATAAEEAAAGVAFRPLEALLAEADLVSLHLPLLPETRGLIGRERLAAMKPGAILVNCARGGLVDEAALHAALASGHLFAAAIDAFAAEPPVGSPLLALDQTVVTPHTAGGTLENFRSVAERAVANAVRVLHGQPLPPEDLVAAPSAARLAAASAQG